MQLVNLSLIFQQLLILSILVSSWTDSRVWELEASYCSGSFFPSRLVSVSVGEEEVAPHTSPLWNATRFNAFSSCSTFT